MILITLLISTLLIASVYVSPDPIEEVTPPEPKVEIWIPTAEDIAYQDSMYTIIQNTQSDIDTIKDNIVYIIERLDHVDGTSDSIRYVEGGKIDKKRN